MTIDFEKDQQDAMSKTENIQSLADQVAMLEGLHKRIETSENNIKDLKKEYQRISGEVIPTMMSEMGLAELKLQMDHILKFQRRIVLLLQKQIKRRRLTGFGTMD